jgi:hypothetical protein
MNESKLFEGGDPGKSAGSGAAPFLTEAGKGVA